MSTNDITQALEMYDWADPDTPDRRVMHMLADIRHYCDEIGASFRDIAKEAHGAYLEDLASQ